MYRIHVMISGKVQDVFFRISTQDKANELNLTGWVKNIFNNAVEIIAEGDREELSKLTEQNKVSAWKAMGAGGGGVVGLIISSEHLRDEIIDQFNVKGWTNIPWKIDIDGVTRQEFNL